MKNYPTELIQVAAVALAAWEDFMAGKADATGAALSEAQAKVYAERRRQDAKWGNQHHTCAEWLSILLEEVGETAQAINEQELWGKYQ